MGILRTADPDPRGGTAHPVSKPSTGALPATRPDGPASGTAGARDTMQPVTAESRAQGPFRLTDEQQMLRDAVRVLADDRVAPRAADIDRTAEFPWDVHDALVKADFHALHVPEQYGGAGGDALASVLVIEEVARACATSSLIPAVNKLGSMPLLLGASEEVKQKYLAPLARGEAMFSYALSEPASRSDRP